MDCATAYSNSPAPDKKFTVADILNNGRPAINSMKLNPKTKVRILVTGQGRASQGAQFILKELGIRQLSVPAYLCTDTKEPVLQLPLLLTS